MICKHGIEESWCSDCYKLMQEKLLALKKEQERKKIEGGGEGGEKI